MKGLLTFNRSARWLVIIGISASLAALLPLTVTMAAGDPVNGKALYQTNCASCHGANAAGGLKIGEVTAPDLRWGALGTAYHGDQSLVSRAILTGIDQSGGSLDPAMPRWQGKLTAAQADNISAFLATLPSPAPVAAVLPKTGGPAGTSDLPWMVAVFATLALAGFGLRRITAPTR